jgi:hypothetical protein
MCSLTLHSQPCPISLKCGFVCSALQVMGWIEPASSSGQANGNSRVHFSDRYALGQSEPLPDASQDYWDVVATQYPTPTAPPDALNPNQTTSSNSSSVPFVPVPLPTPPQPTAKSGANTPSPNLFVVFTFALLCTALPYSYQQLSLSCLP